MSASIFWRPTKSGKHYITPLAPSSFLEALKLATGAPGTPMRLDASDIGVLRGLAAAWDGDRRESAQELIEAIEKHEEIEVDAEY